VSGALGQLGPPGARVGRRLGQVRVADLRSAAAGERRLADEAFVEDAAEGVDVALAARLAALDQLGRQVVRRPEQLAVGGQAGRVRAAGEAEVRQRRCALAVEQDVRRLDVAVQHALPVQGVKAAPELGGELNGVVEPERAYDAQPQGERATRVEGHREVLDAV
jgi:hypothetical protein